MVRLDVTDDASIDSALDQGIRAFGGIDVLVNNAGYGAYGLIEATPIEHIRKEFETNVIGMLAMVRAITPHFRERGSGTIVNWLSMGGKIAMPLGSLYHGSKFAVEGATEALQYEMAAFEQLQRNAGDAGAVAETIYRAATDRSHELRYPSGKDAEQFIHARRTEDDAVFTSRVRKVFGLDSAIN